jgi:hypothetical protein
LSFSFRNSKPEDSLKYSRSSHLVLARDGPYLTPGPVHPPGFLHEIVTIFTIMAGPEVISVI